MQEKALQSEPRQAGKLGRSPRPERRFLPSSLSYLPQVHGLRKPTGSSARFQSHSNICLSPDASGCVKASDWIGHPDGNTAPVCRVALRILEAAGRTSCTQLMPYQQRHSRNRARNPPWESPGPDQIHICQSQGDLKPGFPPGEMWPHLFQFTGSLWGNLMPMSKAYPGLVMRPGTS